MTYTPEQIANGMDDMWANNLPDILLRVLKDQENGRFDPRVTVWMNEDTDTPHRAALAPHETPQ